MNATELYLKEGKSAGIYYCGKCRNVAASQHLAEQCCQNYLCSKCGKDVGSRSWLVCDSCRAASEVDKERERFEKAEKLTAWGGLVYLDGTGRDGFSESISDFWDNWESDHDESDEKPKYVWACKANHFVRADLSDITEPIDGAAYEDWDWQTLNGLDDLKAALDKFNEANAAVCSYLPDYSKAILLNDKGQL